MYDRGKNQIYFYLFFSILPFLILLFQEIKYLAMWLSLRILREKEKDYISDADL